jgi:hypothetical protein
VLLHLKFVLEKVVGKYIDYIEDISGLLIGFCYGSLTRDTFESLLELMRTCGSWKNSTRTLLDILLQAYANHKYYKKRQ